MSDDDVMRKAGEAWERIRESRTPEHNEADRKRLEAKARLAAALMDYLKWSISCEFEDFIEGDPARADDALDWMTLKDDLAIKHVLGNLTHESYQEDWPNSVWWMLAEIIDMLTPLERNDIVAFWRAPRS